MFELLFYAACLLGFSYWIKESREKNEKNSHHQEDDYYEEDDYYHLMDDEDVDFTDYPHDDCFY